MKKLSIYLSILLLGLITLPSCKDDLSDLPGMELQVTSTTTYEEKLKDLSLYMGEVLKDRDARRELFEFAKLEGNANDVEYSLKKLFDENVNPNARTRASAIVKAFRKGGENLRHSGEDFDVNELIDFINENEIGILAPYLAENFDPENLNELTISWWTQEREEAELENDPDWEGDTPGVVLKLNEAGHYIRYRTGTDGSADQMDEVIANDAYAMENPTIVFGSFGENLIVLPGDGGSVGGGGTSPSSIVRYPHQLGANCTNLRPNDIVRYVMPDFRITGNTRPYPWGNYMTIWAATMSAHPNQIVNDKKISRGDFNWKTNFAPVLLTSFNATNGNVQIGMSYKKSSYEVNQIVSVTSVNSKQEFTNSLNVTFKKNPSKLMFTQSWDRCAELNGNYLVNFGNGFRGPLAIHEFGLRRKNYKVQFTLAPQIVRFN